MDFNNTYTVRATPIISNFVKTFIHCYILQKSIPISNIQFFKWQFIVCFKKSSSKRRYSPCRDTWTLILIRLHTFGMPFHLSTAISKTFYNNPPSPRVAYMHIPFNYMSYVRPLIEENPFSSFFHVTSSTTVYAG